jgi:hypothetical protein
VFPAGPKPPFEDAQAAAGNWEKVPLDQKDYQLTIEPKENHLYVFAKGIRTRATVAALTREVFDTARDNRLEKVLINVRELTGSFGVIDIYMLVSDVFEALRGKGVYKAAIVDVRTTTLHEAFLETAARNRGYDLKVFEDEETARMWLA